MLNSIKVNNTDSEYTHSIFDITEYTGKTYNTLTDALADVPQEKQKGGMPVAFVSVSGNRYVQYRLMSNIWNTYTYNWQDIGTTTNWYCATAPLKPTIVRAGNSLALILNSELIFLGAGNNYGSVAADSRYDFPHTNMYLVVSTSESEIITPSFIGSATAVTYYLHMIDRSDLRPDYKVVFAYNSNRIWSRNNWASLSDDELLDLNNKISDAADNNSRINNRNFYILGKISIIGDYGGTITSNQLDIFDNAGGYRWVRNFPLTISSVQNLYLSASEDSFVEPDLTTRGSGQILYLFAAEYSNQISEKARDFLVLGHNGGSFYDPFNLIEASSNNNSKFVNWFASCNQKPTVISNGGASYTITLNSPLIILGSGDNYGNVAAGSSYTLPGANNFLVLSTSESEVVDPELEGDAADVTYYIHVVHRYAIRPTTKVLAYSLAGDGLFSKDNWIGLSDYEIRKLSSDVDILKQMVGEVDYPLLPPELPIQNPLLRNSKLINLVQNKKQDVTIIHLGDSISTNGRYSQPLPDSEAAYNPPRMDEKYLIYFMEAMLRWRGQEYRRSDAKTEKGGDTNMFTEVGTAETKYYDAAWDWQYETMSQNWYNLWTRILTGTNETPASVTFTIPAGVKRFAFIYRTDYLCASQTRVTMSSNVAKIIQSDGTLVEANDYTFSMKEQDEILTKTITSSDGTTRTNTMRKSRGQVRLDFQVDNTGSAFTVTIQNVGAGRLNYWGVEYTPYDKFFRYINVSRGGHNLDALKCFEEWDVDAFKPDAIIVGTPIINEGAMSVVSPSTPNTPEVFANRIKDRFDELSDKSYSPEVIPYVLYIGMQANIVDQTTGQYRCSSINNYGYVDVFKYVGVLDNLLETTEYPIINLFNRIDEYAHKLADSEGTDNIWLSAISGSGSTGKTLTTDGVHLNNHGSLLSFRLIKEFFNF